MSKLTKAVEGIEMMGVESSNIKAIGHDSTTSTLQVEFSGGSIYQYRPVTQRGFEALRAADSIGSFFQKNIRNNELVGFLKVKGNNT